MVSTESHVSSLLTWLVLWRCEGRLGRAGLAVGAPPVSLAVGLARGWAAITWTTGSKQRQFLFPTFSFSPAPSLPFLNNSVLSAEPGRRVRRHQGAVGPSRWPASRPGLGGDAIHEAGGPAREVGPAVHTVDPGWRQQVQSEAPGESLQVCPLRSGPRGVCTLITRVPPKHCLRHLCLTCYLQHR